MAKQSKRNIANATAAKARRDSGKPETSRYAAKGGAYRYDWRDEETARIKRIRGY